MFAQLLVLGDSVYERKGLAGNSWHGCAGEIDTAAEMLKRLPDCCFQRTDPYV